MASSSVIWFFIMSLMLISLTNGSQASRSDLAALIQSKEGRWGTMSDFIYCDDNHFANGIELIVEPDQGNSDDTSANGFRLKCTDGSILYADNDGVWGSLTYTKHCNESKLIYGFRTKIQDSCGTSCDDTALNSISGYCTDNSELILNPNSSYGEWGESVYCPEYSAVCGFRQQVEDACGDCDDTSLNTVELACCYYVTSIGIKTKYNVNHSLNYIQDITMTLYLNTFQLQSVLTTNTVQDRFHFWKLSDFNKTIQCISNTTNMKKQPSLNGTD